MSRADRIAKRNFIKKGIQAEPQYKGKGKFSKIFKAIFGKKKKNK